MPDYKLLESLCMINGISGDEYKVREFITEQIKDYADDIKVDNLGNLIVFKKGKKRAENKLMISAHMDEVGFMVTDITSDGYIKFDEVGGVDRRILLGKQVTVGNAINGVIGVKPVHLTNGDESSDIPALGDMYIDIGACSADEALKYVSYGDSINFVSSFYENGNKIISKALDDRFGCFVLINLIKSELEYDMHFVFCVQEEVGLRGATVAAYNVNPEFALVIESTTAADIPCIEESKQVCNLSEGAVISVMDRATIYDKQMVSAAFNCAEKIGVKAQYKRAVAGGNDSGAIHKSRRGVRTLAVSLPCRYIHSPFCVADKRDCESIIKLCSELAKIIAEGKLCGKVAGE